MNQVINQLLPSSRSCALVLIILSASLLTATLVSASDDYDAPVIPSISVDKTSVDVRNGHQIVTFDIVATDPSGLGRIQMHLRNKKPDGTSGTGSKDVVYDWNFGDELGLYSNQTTLGSGEIIKHQSNQLVFDSSNFNLYEVAWVSIKDKPGNSKNLYLGSSDPWIQSRDGLDGESRIWTLDSGPGSRIQDPGSS